MKIRKFIGFHDPKEENGFLSNWYPSRFTEDGKTFSSLEQYMMYRKALVFGDENSAARILETDDPGQIKALGRSVSPYDDRIWNGLRQIAVYEGLLAKFSQNDDLKDKLLATGGALLAECAEGDKIWGIGLSETDPRRLDTDTWRGQNLLGFTLMRVREALRD